VALLGGARTQIAETRKTAPGLRVLDKYAARMGGGAGHRQGLFDAVLIKDNHWRLAGGVGEAIERARRGMAQEGRPGPIEIEVGTIEEVEEALRAGADALLLDNMERAVLHLAVAAARGRAFLEVSGGVREEDIPHLASLGVDRISLGALTHSVRAADLALEVAPA
jgi:nicotinate-nucleotide pyrophosphorylase (carboxylating)